MKADRAQCVQSFNQYGVSKPEVRKLKLRTQTEGINAVKPFWGSGISKNPMSIPLNETGSRKSKMADTKSADLILDALVPTNKVIVGTYISINARRMSTRLVTMPLNETFALYACVLALFQVAGHKELGERKLLYFKAQPRLPNTTHRLIGSYWWT